LEFVKAAENGAGVSGFIVDDNDDAEDGESGRGF
jgi:hypothetical protein